MTYSDITFHLEVYCGLLKPFYPSYATTRALLLTAGMDPGNPGRALQGTPSACASVFHAVVGPEVSPSCVDTCDIYQGAEGRMSLALAPLGNNQSSHMILFFLFLHR